MKKITCIILLFVLSGSALLANKVKGEVRDLNNTGVAFASVIISSAQDSSLVKATITDANGGFTLNQIENGDYYVSVSFVGYNRFDSNVFSVRDQDYDLPPIILESDNIQLEAVEITGQKAIVEVLADKTVFNVTNTGGTAGLNGFELLRRSPGVILDNNNNIIVEGKSGVQVWFDGKPSILTGDDLTQYLRSLQASDIEAIEIITQPSSKYDAEGNAGIINIRLKKDKRYGTNGSVSAGAGYGQYWKYNSSISVNNRTRKTNLYGTVSNNHNQNFNKLNFRRTLLGTLFDQESTTVNNNDSYNLKAGLDVFVSPKSTLGFIATGNLTDGIDETDSDMNIGPVNANDADAILIAQSNSEYDNENLYLNFNYRFEDTLGHYLNMDVDYGKYDSERINDQPNNYFDGNQDSLLFRTNYQMITPLDITIQSVKLDYEQDFLNGKLGLGVKGVEVVTDNTFDFFEEIDGTLEYQPDQSNQFEYTEQVLAGYFNYSYRKDKLSYQFGLRAENTSSLGVLTSTQMTEDDRVKREYLDWFPSGGLTYNYHPKNTIAVNYSRRINRPDYESLNPFEYRLNELGFQKGNPFLKPNYTNNISISNTHNYTFTTTVSYSHVKDFFAQVIDTLDSQVTFLQTRNVASEEVWSLSASYPFQVNDWWSVFVNATFYNTSYTANEEAEKFNPLERSTFNFYGQNSFNLPNDWIFELSGWFNSPSIWGGTFKTGSNGSVDASIQKKFLQNQLTASLSVSDIFLTTPWTGDGNFGALVLDADGSWESRVVRLNLQYSFGNQELKIRKRKTGTEDEINRI